MRTRFMAALATLGVVGVAALPAPAEIIDVSFPITVSQEVPPWAVPGPVEPSGVGFLSYDTDANSFTYEIAYAGLTGPITGPGAHIHGPADIGENAGVLFFLAGGDSGNPLPQPASGILSGTVVGVTEAQETDFLNSLWYVNIHTEAHPAGEIRGQIIVPEPTTGALLAVPALLALRRRR